MTTSLTSGILLHHADEGRGAGIRIGVGGRVDLLVDDLDAGLLERVDHADGALAAVAALALEAPDEGRVAALQRGALDRLGRRARSRRRSWARRRSRSPSAAYFFSRVRQRGVEAREDAALRIGLVDQRIGRRVAAEPVGRDAVDLGGDRLLDLGQHRVRIPVRKVVGHLRDRDRVPPGGSRCRRCWRTRRPAGRPGRRRCARRRTISAVGSVACAAVAMPRQTVDTTSAVAKRVDAWTIVSLPLPRPSRTSSHLPTMVEEV